MRQFAWCVVSILLGCGDDGATPDAPAANYDLSCVGSAVATTPDPLLLTGVLKDVTNPTLGIFPVPNTEVRVVADSGGAVLASAMADQYGHFTLSVPSGHQPVLAHLAANAASMAPGATFTSFPLNVAFVERAGLELVQASRIDGLAAALGVTVDTSKGWLEVCIADCAINDFADATLAVSGEPNLAFAMLERVGEWRSESATVHRPSGWVCSVAGAVNLATGPHTLTVTSGTVALGPVAFTVEAGARASVFVVPGVPPRF